MGTKTIIYHNPKCSKSRETLQLLKEQNETIEIVEYLKDTPTQETLSKLIELLNIQPIDLLRKGEEEYKTYIKDKALSNERIIALMCEHPKLIERPIVVKNKKAIIGRPPSLVLDIL